MITDHPHKGAGMFEVASRLVEKRLSRPVQSTIVSLSGFPAPRAAKYLKPKVFNFHPQYIVLQFGATYVQCTIRARSRPTDHRSKLSADDKSKSSAALGIASSPAQPATALSPLRWQIASLIGHFRKIEPLTPLSQYIAAMERMVDDCRSAGITPVVLSPFVNGSRYTTKKAIAYSDALRELHSKAQDTIFVDCTRLLARFPKSTILQRNGFHLSPVGQYLVGEAIGQAIIEDINRDECEGVPAGRIEETVTPRHLATSTPAAM